MYELLKMYELIKCIGTYGTVHNKSCVPFLLQRTCRINPRINPQLRHSNKEDACIINILIMTVNP